MKPYGRLARLLSGAGETRISWNRQGPPGPQGEQGPPRPEGPQGPRGPQGPAGPEVVRYTARLQADGSVVRSFSDGPAPTIGHPATGVYVPSFDVERPLVEATATTEEHGSCSNATLGDDQVVVRTRRLPRSESRDYAFNLQVMALP